MKNLLILFGIAALFIGMFAGAIYLGSQMNPVREASEDIVRAEDLPILGTMPDIEGIAGWINSDELTQSDLEGKVVLIDFWTYSCINCIRTFPYITEWWSKYQEEDFVIIGVHTPEFEFEKKYDNVVEATVKHGIEFPVALDNDYVTWRNFSNHYWPAKYIFDQQGNLRYTHFGEGAYDETEGVIQALLGVSMDLTEAEFPDFANIRSPETYFGYWRTENFASNENLVEDVPTTYSLPEALSLNEWALLGEWNIQYQHAEAIGAGAKFQFHYSASVANLVMATSDGTLQDVIVRLDGEVVPTESLGTHIMKDELTGGTFVQVEFSDLYELIRSEPGEHILEIETLEPGLEIYAITFG
ncbi:hypothetical protein CO174_05200 [Candidatus Uhrbacteria bacterium CG_4_9_14_3_um_filter_50_9]|uniref:Thioredoxin domain-containing protein n=1 Tax=Candidatus Uhrbacteria bacterium CG_4_9_14_3_um_filter_50_9 TaxID=1975035 RepID=A0A2M7XB16_9BACT|nr:MAG: hypothetical protein CO174_05200 [Candidatus Uhrbacteria bacterium CG_4_9_14_3_um_filter_50_9]